ncbi:MULTISPECIES: PTS sugar transporter subunit IIA [Heyndrickxia]|uniref:PTS sugar transporter subunit IIA n=1 Tax=Heyndrickxia TaxID=2837504 RepID=UPI000778F288|nr:PTS sugar transporter subunit IIA [Heyndrickxia coagulans]KYC60124.1 PTS system, galactitol-specific IIA component [Heyndrickxia coagulans]
MGNIPLEVKNIYVKRNFSSADDFFKVITSKLEKEGMIKEGYYNAITNREKTYPTGLDTGQIKVAIPHTDCKFSNKTQLIVTTLEKPVKFKRMDDPDSEVSVSVIILILFDNPNKQLKLLSEIMKIVKNQELLAEILKAKTPEEVYQLLNQ